MTIAAFRTWVTSIFGLNGSGGIDGNEVRDGFLELANQIEAQQSWSPVMTLVTDSARTVVKIVDWTGGVGTKPTINVYLGASGLVSTITSAVDVRGPQGPTGSASSTTKIDVAADNPVGASLARFTNNHATSAATGALIEFHKPSIAIWSLGLPSGDTDGGFVINGWGAGAQPEYIRIAANGRVGIGTAAPAEVLDVNGNVLVQGILRLPSTLSNRKIALYDGPNDHQFYGFGVNSDMLRYQTAITTGDHVFFAASGPSSSVELARIRGNGRMGIGTAAPSEKLEVSGRIATQGLVSTGSAPSIVKNAGLGGSGSATMVTNSNDMAGGVTLTAASGATASSTLATVTFTVAYARAPRILLTPTNANASLNSTRVYAVATASGFSVFANSTGPVDLSVALEFTYVILAV